MQICAGVRGEGRGNADLCRGTACSWTHEYLYKIMGESVLSVLFVKSWMCIFFLCFLSKTVIPERAKIEP